MAVAILERPRGRGRQPATVERERDLRDDFRVELAEGRAFAARVLHASRELRRAVLLERLDIVDATASELGYHAGRRIAQLGSVTL